MSIGSGGVATEIVGVTDDPRRGIAGGGTGVYEFWTADGVQVYLHDTTLVSVLWEPVRGKLGFRFEAERDVLIEFEGVVILEWSQDNEGVEGAPEDLPGQVSDFSYDGWNGFELMTAQSVIGFTARKLVVS
ncbi:hypothetical protein [Kribbella sp. CA-293567]|uniref:hypothetical protein n=1 Tax=Kribbella sp. CA-293567 TaxID=3002436 RepID=UPI0022DDA054|nr:hypothetical protein [Kribbella sp. CA-293567]WBQ06835.1 hypothetical protein OX958_08575 [Kribbella sp. CA-293567]